MKNQKPDAKELAFISELDKYVDEWVAIVNYGSERETVVASGRSIKQARSEAESKGFKKITFFKVPPTDKVFVP
jgi:hypothetical protein